MEPQRHNPASAQSSPDPAAELEGLDLNQAFAQAQVSPWTTKQKIVRALWMILRPVLFRASFHNWYGWRRFILRVFGAKVGPRTHIRNTCRIDIPWNLEIGEECLIGDYSVLYSLGKVASATAPSSASTPTSAADRTTTPSAGSISSALPSPSATTAGSPPRPSSARAHRGRPVRSGRALQRLQRHGARHDLRRSRPETGRAHHRLTNTLHGPSARFPRPTPTTH